MQAHEPQPPTHTRSHDCPDRVRIDGWRRSQVTDASWHPDLMDCSQAESQSAGLGLAGGLRDGAPLHQPTTQGAAFTGENIGRASARVHLCTEDRLPVGRREEVVDTFTKSARTPGMDIR